MTRGTVFLSVDAEGMPYVPSKLMLSPGEPLYGELREIMTRVTLMFAEELNTHGFDKVIIADSHGKMVNIDPTKLPGYAELVRGFPRSLMMVSGAEGSSAAAFIGYHTSPGIGGVLAHTYSGRIVQRVDLYDQRDATEYLINTYLLGEMGVPLILVAGDAALRKRVERHTPWALFIPLKQGVSSMADRSPSFSKIKTIIREGVATAVRRLDEGKAKPLTPEDPTITLELKRPWFADIAELFPCVERVNGVTVRLTCGRFSENVKLLEGIVIASYSMT